VVGSTLLVQKNETLAHERIQDTFRRFSETISNYDGVAHEIRGDALVAEFSRASDAVSASLTFQTANTTLNEQLSDDIRPILRIGIAMGEVVVADNTVTGEGVVLAQRIEQLAESGNVCIQGAAYETVPKRLPFDYENLGEQQVKGFDELVRIYRVELKPGQVLPQPEPSGRSESTPLKRNSIIAIIAVALVILGGSILWLQPWAPEEEPASIERMAFPIPGKPSIAVLPFANLSSDSEQEYFSDGITQDIITNLSRFPDLFVIARNSTFTYKGQSVTVRQVAEELGVQYVLEGSVQKAGSKVRITVQLVDATTGHHLWAENYDRNLDDIFAVRDEVTRSIVATLMGADYGKLAQAELERLRRKDTENLEAYEYVLRSTHIWLRFTNDANSKARRLAEKAIDLDPGYARAYIMLAWVDLNAYRWKWSDDPEKSLEQAYEMARKSIELDDSDSWSHWALGVVYLYRGDHEDAIAQYNKALALNPNDADVLAHMGLPLSFAGQPKQAIEQLKRAMRLNPAYPAWYPWIQGWAQVVAEQYEASIASSKEAAVRFSDVAEIHRNLAVAYHYLGRTSEARLEAEESRRIDPEFTLDDLEASLPFADSADLERFLLALRESGLPEHPHLPLPDKPSIAVLPFTNMSSDAEQEFFADGMTEDLITDISKVSGLFVIARDSVFTYKGKAVKVRQVAEELGVRYVMEGSVRRVGNQVRINAQLIDATTGGHIWAERYDGSLDDVFSMQDKITRRIVTALVVKLTVGEKDRQVRKDTNSSEAYDAFLRGWAHYQLYTPDDFAKAIPYLEKAVQLDPDYGRAHAALASVYFDISTYGWIKSLAITRTDANEKSRQHLEEALKNATPLAHLVASKWRMEQSRWDEAIAEAERAITLDANDPTGYAALSNLLVKVGRPAEGLELIETAMRLDPQTDYLYRLGEAQFQLERYNEAAVTMLRATRRNPGEEWNFLLLAAAYGYLGREQEARSAIDTFNEMRLKLGMHSYTLADIDDWYFKDAASRERLREGLRKGGLPAAKLVPRVAALSADELRSLFSGNTATGDSGRGRWHVYWATDGKAFMRAFSGLTDEGTWEINDNEEFCRQFANFGGGRKACFIYIKKGDEYEIWTADRSRMRGTLKVRPGNPENL
jgi:adenylate cyclase